ALERRAYQPRAVRGHEDGEPDARGLHDHAACDQALAADAVGQRARDDLEHPTRERIHRLDHADALDAQAVGGEEQWIDTPGHSVIEIVDQASWHAANRLALPRLVVTNTVRSDGAEARRGRGGCRLDRARPNPSSHRALECAKIGPNAPEMGTIWA